MKKLANILPFALVLALLAISAGTARAGAELKPILRGEPTPTGRLNPVLKGGTAMPAADDPQAERVTLQPRTAQTPKPVLPPPAEETSEPRSKPKPSTPRTGRSLDSLLKMNPSLVAREQLRLYLVDHRDAPEAPRAMLRIAEISEKLDEPDEARKMYEAAAAAAMNPTQQAQAQAALARLATPAATAPTVINPGLGQLDLSMMTVIPTLSEAPKLAARGQYAEAEKLYAMALSSLNSSRQPEAMKQAISGQILIGLGLVNELQGKLTEARKAYRDATQIAPNTINAKLAAQRLVEVSTPIVN